MDNTKYFVLKKKAVPEVLLKVVETKRLLATNRGIDVYKRQVKGSRGTGKPVPPFVFLLWKNVRSCDTISG